MPMLYRGTSFENIPMFYSLFTIVIAVDKVEDHQHRKYISNTKEE